MIYVDKNVKNEAFYIGTQGSKEAQEMLQQENELRTEIGQPTVQEALKEKYELIDFGVMTEEEMLEALQNGKVIWERP